MEQRLLTVVIGIILFLTILYYINNPGEDRLLETIIVGGLIGGALLAVYGIIAGNMGVYEATVYLKKYDTIKILQGKKKPYCLLKGNTIQRNVAKVWQGAA